jgi:myo-inositol-1(or 4)-monophosphatase
MGLDQDELKELSEAAIDIAWTAGSLLVKRFRGPMNVRNKSITKRVDPVTDLDNEVEDLIGKVISTRFPHHGIIGEEGTIIGAVNSDLVWVIDPLDGTLNYANGIPIFACSISLCEKGIPVVGAIYIPWINGSGKVFYAYKGGGTWVGETQVRVSSENSLQKGRVSVLSGFSNSGFRVKSEFRGEIGESRAIGSIAFEMALTAEGVYQYVFFSSPKSWDVAAGIILLQEAGGTNIIWDKDKRIWKLFESFTNSVGNDSFSIIQNWQLPLLSGSSILVEKLMDAIALPKMHFNFIHDFKKYFRTS